MNALPFIINRDWLFIAHPSRDRDLSVFHSFPAKFVQSATMIAYGDVCVVCQEKRLNRSIVRLSVTR